MESVPSPFPPPGPAGTVSAPPPHVITVEGCTLRVADIVRMELADLGRQYVRAVTDDGKTHLLDGNAAALCAGIVIPETRGAMLVEVEGPPAAPRLRVTPVLAWLCLGLVPAAITLGGIQPKPAGELAVRLGPDGPIYLGDGRSFDSEAGFLAHDRALRQREKCEEPSPTANLH